MSQLLAGGLIALGVLIFGTLIFIVSREKSALLNTPESRTSAQPVAKPVQPAKTPTAQVQEENDVVAASRNADEMAIISNPVVPQAQLPVSVAKDDSPSRGERAEPTPFIQNNPPLPAWWHEQFQSLTVQLQYLREHAKDVEQQIAILGEIARLAGELEAIQGKHVVLSEDKPLQFPRRVNRESMDGAYLTDKRPAVRKYTIKAM